MLLLRQIMLYWRQLKIKEKLLTLKNKVMDVKTIVLLTIILALVVIIFWLICKLDKALYSLRDSSKCEKHAQEKLDEAVDTILRLEEHIGVVKRLRYEESCKTALMNEIRSMFFFREFKYPGNMKKHFEKRKTSLLSGDYADEEGQVKAQIYDYIIKGISDDCL